MLKTIEMEIAVMQHTDIRQNIVVPNVSWGLIAYEADIVILTKSGYATEIEIKVSKADLKKDKEKKHSHDSELFKYLYFAVPEKLKEFALTEIPKKAGLYTVYENNGRFWVNQVKPPVLNANHRKWTNFERRKLSELGCMRILGLKKKIYKLDSPQYKLF